MNRRNFIKIWTAVAASLGLPAAATAAIPESPSPELAAGTKVTRIRIGASAPSAAIHSCASPRSVGDAPM